MLKNLIVPIQIFGLTPVVCLVRIPDMQHKEQGNSGQCSVFWGEKKEGGGAAESGGGGNPKEERKLRQKEGLNRSAQNGLSQSEG